MTAEERADLVLAFARVLYVNGQATEQTVGAAERLARVLGLHAVLMPRWGELKLVVDEQGHELAVHVAAEPAGVEMARVAATMGATEDIASDRLAPEAAAAKLGEIARSPPAPGWLFAPAP